MLQLCWLDELQKVLVTDHIVSFIFIYKCEGGCLKRAHLTNTHSQDFFQSFFEGFKNMSPPGVEAVLPSWKVGVVTASPPSRTFVTNQLLQLLL